MSENTQTVGRESDSASRRMNASLRFRDRPDALRFPALLVILFIGATILLAGCSGDAGTGPVEVKWDRDACERCNMVLSDRHHAAQIRHTPAGGGRSRVYKFDDIGCAVLWLDQRPWRQEPGVEIWVTDHRSGDWLDARTAHYVTGQLTPMQYGLGAQPDPAPGSLSFTEAAEHIYRVERELNVHGGNLDHHARSSTAAPAPQTDRSPPRGER